MGWLIGVGILSMLLLVLSAPMMFRSRKGSPLSFATMNAGRIGRSLFDFETQFGKFPDKSTVNEVRSKSGTALTLLDGSSNDLFAQLIVSGVWYNEQIFYAKATSANRADSIFNTDETILKHGECSFAYISGLDSKGDRDTPVVFGPVIPGTSTLDPSSCGGKGVVLRIDGSVVALSINSSGKIILPNGMDILDPRQPFWHGKAPDVRWPK